MTQTTPKADNSREKVKEAFSPVIDKMIAYLEAFKKPGAFVVEVHHDSDEIKVIDVSHTEKLGKTIL